MRSARFLIAAAVLTMPAAALANGDYHKGRYYKLGGEPRAVACYKKVYAPPVTKTVYDRVVVAPGRCETRRVAAVYGYQQREYLVQPGHARLVHTPPVYGAVEVTQQVRPAAITTKRGVWAGEEYKCDIVTPPVYATQTRAVLVEPARQWVERTPPVVGVATEKVILQPEHAQEFCTPPVWRVVAREVVVSPGRWYWRPVEGTVGCARY